MKLLIAGSRSISEFDLEPYIPYETDTIISGGAKGLDAVAERYADEHGLQKIVIRPQYERYRRAAPLKRNEQICKKNTFCSTNFPKPLAESVKMLYNNNRSIVHGKYLLYSKLF